MRTKYLFILVALRVAASFLVPLSFRKHSSQSNQAIPRAALYLYGKDGSDINMLSPLEHFVSEVERINKKCLSSDDCCGDAFRIVSRGANDVPPHENVETHLFYDPAGSEIYIVTAEENSQIDLSKIRSICSNQKLVMPPASDVIQSLCGFPIETLPPLGHKIPSRIWSCTIIFERQLVDRCQEENLFMVGGAGHPYWKSLLDAGCVLKLHEKENVVIADVTASDGDNDNDDVDHDGRVWEISSTPKIATRSAQPSIGSSGLDQFYPKPFFPIDGPPINIARLVVKEKEISNPLTPVFLTAIGRIGAIQTRTKRSIRCEFLPPIGRQQQKTIDEMDDEIPDPHPWMSATSNESMSVDLVFGKVLLQRFGAKQGEGLIEKIQEGQLLQIEAKTNPGQREAIEKWVNTNCLELTLTDCLLLSHDIGLNTDSSDSGGKRGDKEKKMGSSLPILSMDDIFEESSSSSIKLVDNLDTLSDFTNDVSELLLKTSKCEDANMSSSLPLVGIDCEWQPREFMNKKKQPQPVLLLQISLHALEKVYVLDLQTLLRPLESPNIPMNPVEEEVSNALMTLMKSKRLIKVGYQLSSDLRRVFASYPHVSCFQEVRSTLEISSLIKRVLRITKQKKSRYITMSLASMTSHYFERELDKENQMTDWAVRDLTTEQLEYAALDAAVTPKLLEKVMESIDAFVSMDHLPQDEEEAEDTPNAPIIRRDKNDDALAKEIVSCRFFQLPEDNADEETISELQAKQFVGPAWIASSVWTAVEVPSPPIVLPANIA